MAPGFALGRGSEIWSCSGSALLAHQTDGNVVVYHEGTALWSSITAGLSTANLIMQYDGNLVLYGPSAEVRWHSGTGGYSGAWAAIQDDCNFVVYLGSTPLWASNVQCP
jgi:hypothetical protein